jgi:hypothetical protein
MSSTTETPELQARPDEEKQQSQSPNRSSGPDNPDNHFLVQWDDGHDPLNPRSFRPAFKWLIVTIVSVGSLLV